MEQVTVHIEIPTGGTPLLEVPAALVADVADEQDLVLVAGPVPGLPTLQLWVFTTQGQGLPVHVEIPEGSSIALLELPADVGPLDLADEENLIALSGLPGAELVLLKHTAPA